MRIRPINYSKEERRGEEGIPPTFSLCHANSLPRVSIWRICLYSGLLCVLERGGSEFICSRPKLLLPCIAHGGEALLFCNCRLFRVAC